MARRYTGGFLSSREQATDSNSANGVFTLSEHQEKTALGNFPTGRWTPQRSLRFRQSASAYLQRTFPSAGNRRTWTYSLWFKRGIQSENLFRLLYVGNGSNNETGIYLTGDRLQFEYYVAPTNYYIRSEAVFRDPSAWYHFVVVCDTTNATSNDRMRMYVNGVRITAFNANVQPPLNFDMRINEAASHLIGVREGGTNYIDCYMSEVNFIDNQALDASYFGTTDPETGTWVPKRYTGTYGTNGFYLPFSNNTGVDQLGRDFSNGGSEFITNGFFDANVNNWTVWPGVGGSPFITWQASGKARIGNTQNNGTIYYQAISTTIGQTYYVTANVSNISIGANGRTCAIQWSSTLGSGATTIASIAQPNSGTISGSFVATSTTTYILLNVDVLGTGTQGADWDTISVSNTSIKNHWSVTNHSLTLYSNYDSMTDVPGIASVTSQTDTGNVQRGNYNVWNPLVNTRSGGTISDGGLKTDGSLNTRPLFLGTQYFNTGKWYCEIWCGTYGDAGDNKPVGITTIRGQTDLIGTGSILLTYGSGVMRAFANSNNNSLDFRAGDGIVVDQGTGSNWWQSGFWIGFAVDIDNNTMSIYKNGVLSSTVRNCNLSGKEWTYFWEPESSSSRTPATNWYWNFGQQPFVYTPPAGYRGLCTTNLPNPVIRRSNDHFDVKTWTGNGGAITVGNSAKETSAYEISKSLRFRSSVSAYLSRIPTSVGNRRTWTWSAWVKKSGQASYQNFMRAGSTLIRFTNTDTLQFEDNGVSVSTSSVFKDLSWYHVVFAVDTTQASSINRTKIYVNGVQQSLTGTYITQNTDTAVNNTVLHNIGASVAPNEFLNGYMAEVNFIDGQALTPSSFGQFDANNNWYPQRYAGTYGTNGFYLKLNPNLNINPTTSDFNADFLVVAGGGGGGAYNGGGGGAGGLRSSFTATGGGATLESSVGIVLSTPYRITVGAGGSGQSGATQGSNGSNSVFSNITSAGGGRGGGYTGSFYNANPGGSGGAAAYAASSAGGGGVGHGFNGGNGDGGVSSGGGGGASAAGSNGTSTVGGNGGAGVSVSITGTSVPYAGGGGGATYPAGGGVSGGTGGTGGGGNGGANSTGTAGTANRGGGGGGSQDTSNPPSRPGGNGGSGIVIIRIPDTRTATFSGGVTSSLSTSVAGFKIYTVTATSTTSETVTFT